MAEATTAAPIDTKALGEAIAAALAPTITTSLGTAISEANKPLVERLDKLATPAATPAAGTTVVKPGDAAKPLTLEDVGRVVADQLKGFQQQSQQSAQRDAYVGDKLKDLPDAYRRQLGSDPAKWQAEEQAIRGQFKADLEAAGLKPKDVGGTTPAGGVAPSSAVDLSKLNPTQLATMALQGKPAGEAATAAK